MWKVPTLGILVNIISWIKLENLQQHWKCNLYGNVRFYHCHKIYSSDIQILFDKLNRGKSKNSVLMEQFGNLNKQNIAHNMTRMNTILSSEPYECMQVCAVVSILWRHILECKGDKKKIDFRSNENIYLRNSSI